VKDERKFKALGILLTSLCALSMLYAAAQEFVLPGMQGYLKRKLYYETVISKKGLSMHPAKYWRKVDEEE
jgi:hypothetical protein